MAYPVANFNDQLRSDFYRYLTLDLSTYLQSIQGIVDLKLDEKYGCETLALLHWEQLHSILLPDEVKNFYLASNGFELTWKFRIADHNYPVGKMHINVLTELCPVNEPFKSPDKYDGSTRLFVIDTNFSQGSVVLLITKGTMNSSVHYLSSQGQLHQIAESLTAYLRLMLLYMGLPDWPLVHLKMELSYWNKVSTTFMHFIVNKPNCMPTSRHTFPIPTGNQRKRKIGLLIQSTYSIRAFSKQTKHQDNYL
ncbi:tubulin polyglutamylase complex subunit 2-like [Daphnia magna]|uniref:tubulin polyglutamylase complex subunit 2 n=1 Tax=Daphnia magna TaxID=35525 RepID=UPI00140311B8|nr:tubulin polyglutamylase complex subunit 2 [Daphnia magna]XP_045025283.1 tubulin polyglutamylase complex subunit 2-like [Daphnia magna]